MLFFHFILFFLSSQEIKLSAMIEAAPEKSKKLNLAFPLREFRGLKKENLFLFLKDPHSFNQLTTFDYKILEKAVLEKDISQENKSDIIEFLITAKSIALFNQNSGKKSLLSKEQNTKEERNDRTENLLQSQQEEPQQETLFSKVKTYMSSPVRHIASSVGKGLTEEVSQILHEPEIKNLMRGLTQLSCALTDASKGYKDPEHLINTVLNNKNVSELTTTPHTIKKNIAQALLPLALTLIAIPICIKSYEKENLKFFYSACISSLTTIIFSILLIMYNKHIKYSIHYMGSKIYENKTITEWAPFIASNLDKYSIFVIPLLFACFKSYPFGQILYEIYKKDPTKIKFSFFKENIKKYLKNEINFKNAEFIKSLIKKSLICLSLACIRTFKLCATIEESIANCFKFSDKYSNIKDGLNLTTYIEVRLFDDNPQLALNKQEELKIWIHQELAQIKENSRLSDLDSLCTKIKQYTKNIDLTITHNINQNKKHPFNIVENGVFQKENYIKLLLRSLFYTIIQESLYLGIQLSANLERDLDKKDTIDEQIRFIDDQIKTIINYQPLVEREWSRPFSIEIEERKQYTKTAIEALKTELELIKNINQYSE